MGCGRTAVRCVIGTLLFLVACDPGEIVLHAPERPSVTPALSILTSMDTAYASVAESLGWTAGIPGAAVTVHLMTDPYDADYWSEATTDSAGVATIPDLISGLYEVAVSRPLTAAEAERAGAVRIVAGGRSLNGPGPRVEEVTVVPNRRNSLIFSEFGLAWPLPWDIPTEVAAGAKYIELYNNSDTTVYLDGKYWGLGWNVVRDYPSRPCALTEPIRNDPDGIWTQVVFRFPGAGTDHPLPPGGTALVARAAIDHRVFDPRLPDLSAADFEWGGGGAADNPAAPNLEEIGLRAMFIFEPEPFDSPEFLSEPTDLRVLPRFVDPTNGSVWVRIPRALVLDAWSAPEDWTTHSYVASPPCPEHLNRAFERLPGPADALSTFYEGVAPQRRVVTVLPVGRKVLQDTDTSMEDFVKAPRSPGWIPDSLGH